MTNPISLPPRQYTLQAQFAGLWLETGIIGDRQFCEQALASRRRSGDQSPLRIRLNSNEAMSHIERQLKADWERMMLR